MVERLDLSSMKTCKQPIITLRCSTSLVIREIQNKTSMRYYVSTRMVIFKTTEKKVIENAEKLEYLCTGNVNCYSHYGKNYGGSSYNNI